MLQKCNLLVNKVVENKLRIQGRMHFQLFEAIHVFESLIEGFRSCEYRIRYQIDLLYILNFSNPKKVKFSVFFKKSPRSVPQGPFWRIKLYFEPEKRPAGAFWADKIVF